jgi:dihydroorotate dehydrogenase (NAD+) catalytic subunit
MVSIIDGIEMFCLQREIKSVTELVHGVVIEEADDQDLAWLSPPT